MFKVEVKKIVFKA